MSAARTRTRATRSAVGAKGSAMRPSDEEERALPDMTRIMAVASQ
jgi:hypothetical protein